MYARRSLLYRLLNGLVAIYKPPNMGHEHLMTHFKKLVSQEFNRLSSEPRGIRTLIDHSNCDPHLPQIVSVPDIVDSELVLGRRFYPGDFVAYAIDPMDDTASGIQVIGMGEDGATCHASQFQQATWLKTYHLTGMLGRASTDGTALGSTLLRTSWRHVTRQKVERVLAAILQKFRSSSLLHAGLRTNTLSTYRALAGRTVDGAGALRPIGANLAAPSGLSGQLDEEDHLLSTWERNPSPDEFGRRLVSVVEPETMTQHRRNKAPYVNLLRCVEFEPPFFTLELQVAHETHTFLVDLMASLGPKLRSSTLLSRVRRLRHGQLTVAEHALLLKQCTVPTELMTRLSDYMTSQLSGEFDVDSPDLLSALVQSTKSGDGDQEVNLFTNLFHCSRLHPFIDQQSEESGGARLQPIGRLCETVK